MHRWCLLNLTVQGFSLNLTVRGVSNKHCLLTFFIIHEVWPRPFWGEAYRRKKILVDHFIGHIPLL